LVLFFGLSRIAALGYLSSNALRVTILSRKALRFFGLFRQAVSLFAVFWLFVDILEPQCIAAFLSCLSYYAYCNT
jgi:hypothetical protein